MYEVGHSKKLGKFILKFHTILIFPFIYTDFLEDYLERHDLPMSITGCSFKGVSVNLCIHNAVLSTRSLLESLKH